MALNPRSGVRGGGVVIIISGDAYAGSTITVDGGEAPYEYVINGVPSGEFLSDPVPLSAVGGDEVQVRDTNGVLSNILVVGFRTNHLLYSEQFQNAVWLGGSTVVEDSTESPIGTMAAELVSGAAINCYQQVDALTGQESAFSVFLKKSLASTCEIYIFSIGGTDGFVVRAEVNFDSGTASNILGSSVELETLADGWFRLSIRGLVTGTPSVGIYNTTSVYAWGAQLEAGMDTTTYIGPVLGTAITV